MDTYSLRTSLVAIAIIALLAGLAAVLPGEVNIPTLTPDLSITKTDAPDPVTAGESLQYSITVSNLDAVDAANVLITDTLSLDTAFIGASPGCAYLSASHEVACSLATLPMSSTAAVTVSVLVDPGASGVLVNQAAVGQDGADPNPGDNITGPVNTTVGESADLSLDKTDSTDPVAQGAPLTYTLTVENDGPSDADDVELTDNLPGEVTFSSATPDSCDHESGVVTCDLDTIEADQSVEVTIVVDVDAGAAGNLFNLAFVTSDTFDPDPDDNLAVENTQVGDEADLSVTKSDSPDPVIAGQSMLVYTVTVENLGPSIAEGVSAVDDLPDGVTFSQILNPPAGCSHTAGTVNCSLGDLDAGESIDIEIETTVDADASGSILNTASASSSTLDPVTSNNTDSEATQVNAVSDLVLSGSDSPDPVTAGSLLTYSLTVENDGPSAAVDVLLTDTLPGDVSFSSATPGSCSHAGGVVTCDLDTLPPEQSVEVTIVVDVDTTAAGSLVNSAVVSAQTPDPNSSNNSASQTTQVVSQADLAVTIVDDPDPVIAGQSILVYTVTVENFGPSSADGVSAVDVLPDEVTFSSIVAPPGASCDHTSGTVNCSLGDLDAGESVDIEIETTVDEDAAGTLVNTANVNSPTPDPVSGNDMDSETTEVEGVADLDLSGSDFPDPVAAGAFLTYTLTVENNGPSAADQAVLTGFLPAEVEFVSADPDQGVCDETGGFVSCDLGDVGPSQVVGVEILTSVDPAFSGQLFALFEAASNSIDPNPSNNTSLVTTTSQVMSDLQVQKFDVPEALPPGADLTYTILIENLGPSNAAGVVMTDTLPAEVNWISTTPPAGGSCVGTTVITCTAATIAAGGVATTTILVEVDIGTPLGTITNTVSVDSASNDPIPANNQDVQTTIIADEIIDLSLTKTASDGDDPVLPGDALVYTLSVSNAGPSVATSVVVTDTLPAGVALVDADPSQGSCGTAAPIQCDLGSLTAGAEATVTIEVTVANDAPDLLLNTAGVSGAEAESDTMNNAASAVTTVFTLNWIEPVSEGETFDAGVELVPLVVEVTDQLPIAQVVFERWDTNALQWVPLGIGSPDPQNTFYTITVDTATLQYTWNQVRARATDEDGNVSLKPYIWIYRLFNQFMPVILK